MNNVYLNKGKCSVCSGTKNDFGTYNNKVKIEMPAEWETDRECRWFWVDVCLLPELVFLWKRGIRTIECCCGHGSVEGYIAVDDCYIATMHELGYKNCKNKPDRKDLFLPKSTTENEL